MEGGISRKGEAISYKNILVPLDFSAASARALKHALALVGTECARIFLLHVVPPQAVDNEPLDQVRARAEAQLRTFIEGEAAGRNHVIHAAVRTGSPFQEIIAAARENNAKMIVLASHQPALSRGINLGHTIERVSRYAACPVMIVPDPEIGDFS